MYIARSAGYGTSCLLWEAYPTVWTVVIRYERTLIVVFLKVQKPEQGTLEIRI